MKRSGRCARSSGRARRSALFAEGTRQKSGVPGRCSRARRWSRSTRVSPSSRVRSTAHRTGGSPTSSRSASPGASRCASTASRERPRLQGGLAGDPEQDPRALGAGSSRSTRSAAATRDRGANIEEADAAALIRHRRSRRLSERRQVDSRQPAYGRPAPAVVHDTPGVTRDRKELVCEWGEAGSCSWTRAAWTSSTPRRSRAPSSNRRRRRSSRGRPRPLRRRHPRAGITPGDEELATILRNRTSP